MDSWTTAELKSLPNVALQGLLHLFGRFEALGSFPPGAQCVLEVLLDKGAGAQPLSQRNIGILSKVYRVWCKLRRYHLQAWRRQKNWTWSWGSGPGKGAEDAAWLAHFEMEEAQALGRGSAEVLLDSQKCYERIRLDVTEESLSLAGFPGRMGRLALAQYRSPRAMAAAEAVAGWYRAKSGIVAGCGIAADVLSMVNAPHAQKVMASSEALKLRLYVDDYRLASTGAPEEIASCLARATRIWVELLSAEGRVINTKKSTAMASDGPARRLLEKALGNEGIGIRHTSDDMGVDAACVGRRRVVRLRKRTQVANQAAKRGARLSGETKLRARLIKTWMLPKAFYGSKVLSMAKSSVLQLRRASAKILEGRPKGRRCLTTLLAVASHKFDLDPGSTIPANIVADLAAKLWKGHISVERLKPLWDHTKSTLVARKLKTRFIRGPVSAAIHAAGAAGWEPGEVATWRRKGLQLHDVMEATPWETKTSLLVDVEDQLFAEMAQRRCRDSKGAEDGLDFKMALALLWGKYKGKSQVKDTCLRLILQGATWPAARVHEVDPSKSPVCLKCGHCNEDEAHRIWFCPALSAQRARAGVSLRAFLDLGISPPPAFFYRLLVPATWTMRPISDRCCKELGTPKVGGRTRKGVSFYGHGGH